MLAAALRCAGASGAGDWAIATAAGPRAWETKTRSSRCQHGSAWQAAARATSAGTSTRQFMVDNSTGARLRLKRIARRTINVCASDVAALAANGDAASVLALEPCAAGAATAAALLLLPPGTHGDGTPSVCSSESPGCVRSLQRSENDVLASCAVPGTGGSAGELSAGLPRPSGDSARGVGDREPAGEPGCDGMLPREPREGRLRGVCTLGEPADSADTRRRPDAAADAPSGCGVAPAEEWPEAWLPLGLVAASRQGVCASTSTPAHTEAPQHKPSIRDHEVCSKHVALFESTGLHRSHTTCGKHAYEHNRQGHIGSQQQA